MSGLNCFTVLLQPRASRRGLLLPVPLRTPGGTPRLLERLEAAFWEAVSTAGFAAPAADVPLHGTGLTLKAGLLGSRRRGVWTYRPPTVLPPKVWSGGRPHVLVCTDDLGQYSVPFRATTARLDDVDGLLRLAFERALAERVEPRRTTWVPLPLHPEVRLRFGWLAHRWRAAPGWTFRPPEAYYVDEWLRLYANTGMKYRRKRWLN